MRAVEDDSCCYSHANVTGKRNARRWSCTYRFTAWRCKI